MITTEKLSELADIALKLPPGCNDPFLKNLPAIELEQPYLRFMYLLAKEVAPEVIVECGVYMGTCTAHLAAGSPESLVLGVDIDFHHSVFRVSSHYKNIVLIPGDSAYMASYIDRTFLLPQRKQIGILFLDSEHDGLTSLYEYHSYSQMFAEECIVVCDDIVGDQLHPDDRSAMQLFWNNLPGEKIQLNRLHPAYGEVNTPGFGASIVRRDGSYP